MESAQIDQRFKLLILGDSGVGKSSVMLRFAENKFSTAHLPTIGLDFKEKSVSVGADRVKLQIWDTAGQERFKTITSTFYKGAAGIIVGYDCTREESFNNVQRWMEQISEHTTEPVVTVLIGTKYDQLEQVVSTERGEALAQQLGVRFFDTSAKTNRNITETFTYLAEELVQKYPRTASAGPKLGSPMVKQKCC